MAEEEKRIDEDWKKQVHEEKKEIAEEKTAKGQIPQASLMLFISGLATQTYVHMGLIENPITKQKEKDLDQAKYLIDILNILEEKTKGNLTKEEEDYFKSFLYDLRMAYVEHSK